MPSRYRERYIEDGYHNSGEAKALSVGLGDHHQAPPTWPHYYQYCTDFIGNRLTTNPLNLVKEDWVLGWFNGQNGPDWLAQDWASRVQWYYVPGGLDDRNDDVLGTIALARANPSRPTLNVWNFLFELKDIPWMVKQAFQTMRKYGPRYGSKETWTSPYQKGFLKDIFKDIGDTALSYGFGWELLIQDIGKMLDIVSGVEARMKDLSDLYSGDLRKSVTLSKTTVNDSVTNYWGPLYGAVSQYHATIEVEREIWARVRYKPTEATFAFRGQDQYALARRLVYGHDLNMDTLYNALPWSWLVDWFTTAGDYISSRRNTLGVDVDDVAIMRQTTFKLKSVDFTYNPYGASFTANPDWGWQQKLRSRWTGSPVIQSYVPILGDKQLSILAALGMRYIRG